MVQEALEHDFWVSQINTQEGLSIDHIAKFDKLWELIGEVHTDDVPDKITWMLANDVCYLTSFTYKM